MKKAVTIILTLAMALTLAACSPSEANATDTPESSATPATSTQSQKISMSSPMASGSGNILGDAAQTFCDSLSEYTNGTLEASFFGNNALGSQRDMINAMAAGELELCFDGSVPIDLYAPEYGFLVAPFLLRDIDHLRNIVENSQIWQDFKDTLEENGIVVLGTIYRGSRQVVSKGEIDLVNNPAKTIIRNPDVATYISAFSAIGCSVQVLGGGEVYSALQNGVVNATEGPWEQHASQSLWEVTDNLYETNHVQEFYCVYASKTWYDSLDQATKDGLQEAVDALVEDLNEKCEESADTYLQTLIDNGMTFHEVDTDALFERVTPVWEEKFESGEWTSSMDEIMEYYNG